MDRAPATPPWIAVPPATASGTPLLETEEEAKKAVRRTALREQLVGAVRLAAAQEQAAILLDQYVAWSACKESGRALSATKAAFEEATVALTEAVVLCASSTGAAST